MQQLTLSLWLPISRANFYGATDTNWLKLRPGTDYCSSARMVGKDDTYQPLMLVSVLRRLLEVLPYSFAYNEEGRCTFRGDHPSRLRPTSVTMTLDLADAKQPPPGMPGQLREAWSVSERRANDRLRDTGVTRVDLYVDENGAYAFTATYDRPDADARAALLNHIKEVFGGTYIVHPDVEDRAGKVHRKFNAGNASLKEYNGINEAKVEGEPDTIVGPPLGILNFYQLHLMAEGIWNDTLLPLVYLERREWVKDYLDSVEGYEFLRSMERVIEAITTEADATTTLGKINILHHFLTVTANTSLQKLRVALESVRRRLLDEMMGGMHRQRRLVQLNLNSNVSERTPELAVAATENQIKGYATLVAAKLPLIMGVREVARLATEHLEWIVGLEGQSPQHDVLADEMTRLGGQVRHWNSLLDELDAAVHSLETTIEHAWMEQLLYEQKQARSDQEALAEIERSRQSRPNFGSPGRSAYQLAMLFFTAVAGIFAVTTVNFEELRAASTGSPWWVAAWEILKALWVVWAGLLVLFVIIPGIQHLRRAARDKKGTLASYPYEFAFRLDEKLKDNVLSGFVNDRTRYRLTKPGKRPRIHLANRGYGRIERISPDSTIVKIHSTASFRPPWTFGYARFEIIYEILIHRGADRTTDKTQQFLVQCRMFGESPRALTTDDLVDLVAKVAHHIGGRIVADEKISLADLIDETLHQRPEAAAG